MKKEKKRQIITRTAVTLAVTIGYTGYLYGINALADYAEARDARMMDAYVEQTTAAEAPVMIEAVPAPLVLDLRPISIGTTISTGCGGIRHTMTTGSGECQYTYYDVPLTHDVQRVIFDECDKHGIDPAVIIGMCWRESCFRANAIGDNGYSFGLMQIQERYHTDRMARLGVRDLQDPAQNVTVGIDFMAYLIDKYGDVEKALICYNYGEYGAKTQCFAKGITSTSYSRAVLEYAAALGK